MGKHSKHLADGFRKSHSKVWWMPDILGHRQKTANFDELEKRTELIKKEILGKGQEPEGKVEPSEVDQETHSGGTEKE